MTDSDDGQFAYLAAFDEVFHGLRVPCISEVEVDCAELVGGFFEFDDVPFLLKFIGEWLFADYVFACLDCFFYAACPCVGQCEKTDALHFRVVPEVSFVGCKDGVGCYLV